MKQFLRSFFGLNGATGNRTVIGGPEGIEVKDVHYIKDSNKRLTALQELCGRYNGTTHAQKIEAVYHKTKEIHAYLVGRKRVHELELFHLQHTDHFLNTFTVIMDAHQQHHYSAPAPTPGPPKAAPRVDVVGTTLVFGPFRRDRKEVKAAQQLNRETSQRAFADIAEANIDVPRLAAPQVPINTYARVVYLQEDVAGALTTNEIGFTSTPEEKAAFVSYVSGRLGLEGVTYIGNAMVYLPTHTNSHPAEMAPVIHWNGSPYVLSLEDSRLYPVSTYRKSR